MAENTRSVRPSRLVRPAVLLIIAITVLAFSNGRWIVPVATWFAPVFMLRFLDTTPQWTGLAAALVASFLVWSFSWQEMIPAPGWLYFMVTAIYAVVYFVPYLAHRLLATRSAAYLSTLVFPTAWVAVDLLFQRFVSPYGSWTSLAYTQLDFLALVQLSSITGTFGITFLVTWFASTLVWLWRSRFTMHRVRAAAVSFGVPFVAVVVFGAWRLAAVDPAGANLRVAAVIPDEELEAAFDKAFRSALAAGALTSELEATVIDAARVLTDDLLARTQRAAEDGADLIAWSETAARVTNSGARDLVGAGRRLVDRYGITLILGYGTWDPTATPPLGNWLAIQHAEDTSVTHYRKARPIIGAEAPLIGEGDSTIAIIDTPMGRLGAVICHDLDFPDLIREAGAGNVQLMVGPSADWSEIDDMHAGMARLRAVENGFVLVRPTAGGHTIAIDPLGREQEWVRRDGVIFANVQTSRVPTAYAVVGDLFAWCCVVGFVGVWHRLKRSRIR